MVFDGLCLLPSKIWAVSDFEPHLRAREGHLRPKGTAWGWKSIVTHFATTGTAGTGYAVSKTMASKPQELRPIAIHIDIWQRLKREAQIFERQNYIAIQQCPAELRMF